MIPGQGTKDLCAATKNQGRQINKYFLKKKRIPGLNLKSAASQSFPPEPGSPEPSLISSPPPDLLHFPHSLTQLCPVNQGTSPGHKALQHSVPALASAPPKHMHKWYCYVHPLEADLRLALGAVPGPLNWDFKVPGADVWFRRGPQGGLLSLEP